MKRLPHLPSKKMCLIAALIFSLLLYSNGALSQTKNENNDDNEETPPQAVRYKAKKKVFRYNNVFSIYPFQAITNYMTVGYEFKTSDKTAFKTSAGYSKTEQNILSLNGISKYSGYKIEMQLKYFIRKKPDVFNGIYFSPFVLYKACSFTFDDYQEFYDPITGYYTSKTVEKTDKAAVIHAGFILGYHVRMGDSFTLDMFAGEGLMSASGNYEMGSRIFDVYTNAIRMKLGICVGFGF